MGIARGTRTMMFPPLRVLRALRRVQRQALHAEVELLSPRRVRGWWNTVIRLTNAVRPSGASHNTEPMRNFTVLTGTGRVVRGRARSCTTAMFGRESCKQRWKLGGRLEKGFSGAAGFNWSKVTSEAHHSHILLYSSDNFYGQWLMKKKNL